MDEGTSARAGATGRTLLLLLAMAATALALAAVAGGEPLLDPARAWPVLPVVAALAATFVATELAMFHVEFRRETYSATLTGVPLVVGLLVAAPGTLLVARLLGALVIIALRRDAPLKAAYNVASYALGIGIISVGAHRLVPDLSAVDLRAAGALFLVVAVSDLVTCALLLRVIGWHQGPLRLRDVLEVVLPTLVLGVASTVVALTATQLASTGGLGWLLIGLSTPAAAGVHRAYTVLQRRHQSLAVVHDFVADSRATGSADELAERLAVRLRALLRASWVELVRVEDGAPASVRLRAGEDDDVTHLCARPASATEWVLARAVAVGEATLVPRRPADPALRGWLLASGVREAMVVPLVDDGTTIGVLTVADRLGDHQTFTRHDLALAQTLAAHIAVALRNADLMQQLRHEANHDALTGLANRAMVDDVLERMQVELAGRPDRHGAVVLLDLDRFKDVNDALGHHAGDTLLGDVARRLRELAPEGAVVARLGGDEFAVVLPDVDGPGPAVAVADAAVLALRPPVHLGDTVVSTAASIGVAVSAGAGTDCADLLRQADLAMYAAKAASRPVEVYSRELDEGRADRLLLVADLAEAMRTGGLSVVYQPKVDLDDGVVRGVEALVRWVHPTRGFVPPDVFVALAESTGLIGDLTRYVLATALRQARAWRDEGLLLAVAVNLSARNLSDDGLPTAVAEALSETGLPPSALVVEITESSVMGEHDAVMPVLRALRALGVRLSLDDFGTGYSSLSYLQTLPVQEVKIDRSFVQAMSAAPGAEPDPARARLLVRAIIDLATGLGLTVVAEGVEDAPSLRDLMTMGCHVGQGYHLCRPGTPAAIREYLHGTGERIAVPRALRAV